MAPVFVPAPLITVHGEVARDEPLGVYGPPDGSKTEDAARKLDPDVLAGQRLDKTLELRLSLAPLWRRDDFAKPKWQGNPLQDLAGLVV